jgi:hypothetical protein
MDCDLFAISTVMIRRPLDQTGLFDPELRNPQDWGSLQRIARDRPPAGGVGERRMRYPVWTRSVNADRVQADSIFVRTFTKVFGRPQMPGRIAPLSRPLCAGPCARPARKARALIGHLRARCFARGDAIPSS